MRNTGTLAIALLLSCQTTLAQLAGVEYDWQEKKNEDGIQIYTSSVAGSPFKAVRGVMKTSASVQDLVALVDDLPACPKWADLCKEARLESRVSDTETFVYIYNDIPFPVSDRDVYANVNWQIDPVTNKVSMTSRATEGGPEKGKAVRLMNAVSQWHFTPLSENETLVENFAHIDPNGPTPAWMTNLMLVSSPFKTMKKMREITESGEYANTVVPFLNGE